MLIEKKMHMFIVIKEMFIYLTNRITILTVLLKNNCFAQGVFLAMSLATSLYLLYFY